MNENGFHDTPCNKVTKLDKGDCEMPLGFFLNNKGRNCPWKCLVLVGRKLPNIENHYMHYFLFALWSILLDFFYFLFAMSLKLTPTRLFSLLFCPDMTQPHRIQQPKKKNHNGWNYILWLIYYKIDIILIRINFDKK